MRIEPISPEPRGSVARPVMLQEWNNLGFVHWKYPAEEVQRLLPDSLRVDTYGGFAWVGLIGFSMEDIVTPKGVGAGPLSNFPEINVRTYVIDPDGRRNVWFFSLDINRSIPVAVAQVAFGLPYRRGRCSVDQDGDTWVYSVKRWSRKPAATRFVVQPGDAIAVGDETSLELFLTARWGMSTQWRGRMLHGTVDHPRWPLHHATLISVEDSLLARAGLSPSQESPIVHSSPGVKVKIGRLQRVT